MSTAASASGVPAFPEANRHRDPSHLRYPPDPGQLRDAQASGGEEVVQRTPSLSRSLYPDQRLLAEPSRTLVRRDHAQTHPPRNIPLRARPRPSDPGVRPREQQEPATIPMGRERKHDWTTTLLGDDVKGRYADLKQAAADRCPRLLGTFVKAPEVQYHHDVYNQFLWNHFYNRCPGGRFKSGWGLGPCSYRARCSPSWTASGLGITGRGRR